MIRSGLKAACGFGATAAAIAVFGAAPASAQNAAPVCPADHPVTAVSGVSTPINGQCDDPDDGPQPLSYAVVDWPDYGSLGGSPSGQASYRSYTPYDQTSDSFTYYATDGAAQSAVSTVSITIDPPPAGNQPPHCPESDAFVEEDSTVTLSGNCVDPDGDPVSYLLAPPSPTKGTLTALSASSVRYDPSVPGPDSDQFGYSASDPFSPPTNVVVDIDILAAGTDTFETAPDATDTEQYVASVDSPNGGPVNIDRRTTTATPPTGYFMLNEEFDIQAPDATAADPLILSFTFDQSVAIGTLAVMRNGTEVQPCTGAGATPDPCLETPIVAEPDGDHRVTVRTSQASIWTFATKPDPPHAYGFGGFEPPVDDRPALNGAKGGSAVPIKFTLGEDAGDDPFAPGYPKSQQVACGTGGDVPGADPVSAPGASGLKHDGSHYHLNWKTAKSYAGSCRQLVLRFDDPAATTARADFKFK